MKSLVLVALFPALALAQIPAKLAYQGRLFDASGAPQTGVVNMQFGIYDDPTAGKLIWCENQVVALTDGYYAILLGDGTACSPATTTALPDAFAGPNRAIEVSVENAKLSPRQTIATVPFAYVAGSLAGSGASFVQNQTAVDQTAGFRMAGSAYIAGPAPFAGTGSIDTLSSETTVTGHGTAFGTEVVVGDLITINPTSTRETHRVVTVTDATHLTVDAPWAANNNGFQFNVQKVVTRISTSTGRPSLTINQAGRVGIGTAVPEVPLSIVGNFHANFFAGNAEISLRRANGTEAAPTAVANGDVIGEYVGWAYDGANYQAVTDIRPVVAGPVSAGNAPAALTFHTSNTDSTGLTERMRIGSTGIVSVPSQSSVSVSNTTSFTATATTFTKVAYSAESYDAQNEYDTTNYRFKASTAGRYLVCASLWAGSAIGFELDLFVNGTRERAFANSAGSTTAGGCRPIRLNANDFIEIWVLQGSAATQTFPPNVFWSWLTIDKLG
jgi:hypothetical protein